jgi:hypothetical protein
MSNTDETSDSIFLAVQCLNPSQTNGNTIQGVINNQTNPIVDDLSKWNVYLQSLTLTTAELPYFNCFRNIINPTVNANVMNLSITFFANDGTTPFKVGAAPFPPNLIGFGANAGAGVDTVWQGVTVFLTYVSENLPNSTGRAYYNIHSINQFIGLVNNAIGYIIGIWQALPAGITTNTMYFSYDPVTQFYQLAMPEAFKASNIDIYENAFLERLMDGFRWIYNGVNYNIGDAGYTGQDYKFVKTNYPMNYDAATEQWTYTTEYSCIANMLDVHSILISSNSGSLQNVRQQIVPISNVVAQQQQGSLNLPTIACLKNLDIDFSNLTLSSINNCFIQYESQGCFFPINTLSNTNLNNISLQIYIQTIDNQIYPLNIPAGCGYANVKFILKRKVSHK